MYKGYFKDINDVQYSVEIVNAVPAETELIMGTPPFSVSVEGDENIIYKPIKGSTATVTVVDKDYRFDLYSSNAHENKVILKRGNDIVWIGYVSPNLYSQPYDNDLESFDIECIDGISTLQYYDYEEIVPDSQNIYTFVQLIDHILTKCECYTKFHISNSIKIKPTDKYNFGHYAAVSESNFIPDDEPDKYQDVLEQICQFMNMTCLTIGDEVYFVNYDEIKNGQQTYDTYLIGGDLTKPTITTIDLPVIVKKDLYRGDGNTLSLDAIYNKVSVVAEHNSLDELFPDMFDDDFLYQRLKPGEVNKYEEFRESLDDNGNKTNYSLIYQWFKHKYHNEFFYDLKTLKPIEFTVPFNMYNVVNYIGGVIMKYKGEKYEKGDFHDYQEIKSDLGLTKYLLLSEHKTNTNLFKLYTIKQHKPYSSPISSDSKLMFSGKVTNMIAKGKLYPTLVKPKNPKVDIFHCTHELYIPLIIKLNNLYYNTDSKKWQDTECVAKIPLYHNDIDDKDTLEDVIGKELHIRNNVGWNERYDKRNGFAIDMPFNVTNISNVEVTFVNHWDNLGNILGAYIDYVFVSDFKVDLLRYKKVDKGENIYSPYYKEENEEVNNETDTIYENIIDENFVEEMDEITFNICTDDGKANATSSVVYDDGNGLKFLDTTTDSSTNQTLRQEEHLIYRLVSQYKEPAIRINSTLVNNISPLATIQDVSLPNKTFIVDSQEIDYEYAKTEINLVEKK